MQIKFHHQHRTNIWQPPLASYFATGLDGSGLCCAVLCCDVMTSATLLLLPKPSHLASHQRYALSNSRPHLDVALVRHPARREPLLQSISLGIGPRTKIDVRWVFFLHSPVHTAQTCPGVPLTVPQKRIPTRRPVLQSYTVQSCPVTHWHWPRTRRSRSRLGLGLLSTIFLFYF